MTTLAFDLGNVLFGFDYTIALEKIKGKMGASVDDVIDEFYQNDFTLPFEKGVVSEEEFYLNFKKTFSATFSYEKFVDIWCEIFFIKPEVIELVKKLTVKYPTYLISNINKLHFQYLYRYHREVFDLFKGLILSFEVKSVKPEKKIYDDLKAACEVDFKEIIYIDDRPDLIEAATKLGIRAIQFIGLEPLIKDLKSFNIAFD